MQTIINIIGTVQGVGFRYWTKGIADKLGLKGTVQNQSDGSVITKLDGSESNIRLFIDQARSGPPASIVSEMHIYYSAFDCPNGFHIIR